MSLFYSHIMLEIVSNVYNLTMYKIINFSYFVRLSLKLITYQRMLQKIENWFFKFRLLVLLSFVLLTLVMGYFAVQIRMDAGFYKQLPSNHSFVKTYYEYQDDLSGTNSITVALRTTDGDIFNQEYLKKLFELNQTIRYLPGVNQGSMQSLWTPNVKVMRVTEEGFESTEVIPGNLTIYQINILHYKCYFYQSFY